MFRLLVNPKTGCVHKKIHELLLCISLHLEGFEIAEGGLKAVAVATMIIVAVSVSALLYFSLSDNSNTTYSLDITSLRICGNSTDILYPELMDASLVLQERSLVITASFVDDSEGYENPLLYEREFTVTPEEIESISLSLNEGMNQTHPSEMSSSLLLESSPNMGFEIEIVYSDGSWVYVITFQVGDGYIMFNNGT
ncbi:MAG: hypothetical protein ACFFEE_04930, partial [Candidatus Thorarchaeota archaeon]